jgi:hypothetical protein
MKSIVPTLILSTAMLCLHAGDTAAADRLPNIVFIMVDDLAALAKASHVDIPQTEPGMPSNVRFRH